MNQNALRKFLIESNKAGYAEGNSKKWIKEKDGSTTIPYVKGDWKSHDNFFGGEPYGGRLVVFYKEKPVWIMVYYGWVAKSVSVDPVYAILREALKRMPGDAPFRGPKKYKEGDLLYSNSCKGNVEKYSGEEMITKNKLLIYKANYRGGVVDAQDGV